MMMMMLARSLVLAACLGTLASAADAQPTDSNVTFKSGIVAKKPTGSGLPDVKAQPQAWPRLDPGAALCRTEDDLDRLAARRGGETINGPIDCQMVRTPTAVSIVQRKGPGKTEVAVTGPKDSETGWTDVWLPAKAPGNARSAAR